MGQEALAEVLIFAEGTVLAMARYKAEMDLVDLVAQ